jgi:hypothetical protein
MGDTYPGYMSPIRSDVLGDALEKLGLGLNAHDRQGAESSK